jgi:hypothetical protein
MADVISDYQKWKQEGESLRVEAKRAMESRFRELLEQAVRMAEEYRADFGGTLKPPQPVTSFRYKAPVKKVKVRKDGTAAKQTKPQSAPVRTAQAQAPEKANTKGARLEKRLATARQKLDAAKAAGSPTRPIEDRIYELEDELRLVNERAASR